MFNFLIFCSGADKSLLEKCPTPEIAKYEGIGGTVFFTALFAMLSGGYALSTLFYKDDFISFFTIVVMGIIWGLFIFNLDRYIVSSMIKEGHFWSDLVLAIPRLVLAILLAFVISTPLELKIFEDKINLQLAIDAQNLYKIQEDSIRTKNEAERKAIKEQKEDIKTHKKEMMRLEEKLIKMKNIRDQLDREARIELTIGYPPERPGGDGPIYKKLKAEADNAKQEFNEQNNLLKQKQNELTEMVKLFTSKKKALDSQENAEIVQIKQKRGEYKGFAERLEAFSNLKIENNSVWFTYLFITLLFISIETAPIFVKIISKKGAYDILLEKENSDSINEKKNANKISREN